MIAAVVTLALTLAAAPAVAASPSFDCRRARAGTVAAVVCADEMLAALDRRLAEVYAAAQAKAAAQRPPRLKAEQRDWIRRRDDCRKVDDRRGCAATAYRLRIAELQARYRLVPGAGPLRYVCDRNPEDEVVVHLFATDPPSIVAERGDRSAILYRNVGADGPRYVGRSESFREAQTEALIRWGADASEMRCIRIP